ncbi:MAG TPA: phage holin family protein [Longimicrobiales bacterium]
MATEHRFPAPEQRRDRTSESLGDLLRQLGDDGTRLLRQEVALAKLEMRELMAGLVRDLIGLAVAGTLAVLGALALTATLILVLGRFVFGGNYWLGALVVGGVFLIVGGIWALAAARGLGQNLKPDATLDSVRADVNWAKREAQDFKREVM